MQENIISFYNLCLSFLNFLPSDMFVSNLNMMSLEHILKGGSGLTAICMLINSLNKLFEIIFFQYCRVLRIANF